MTKKTSYDEALEPVNSVVIDALLKNRSEFQKYLSRRLDSPTIAEEILQQSFLKAVEHEAEIENPENILPWFYRVLRNSLIDYFRSRSVDSKKVQDFIQELERRDAKESSAPDELKNIICACLDGLVKTLKPEYGELVRKIDLEGAIPEAVAKDLKITPNNLWVRLHRARQALRKSLERSCGACSQHACLDCTCKH